MPAGGREGAFPSRGDDLSFVASLAAEIAGRGTGRVFGVPGGGTSLTLIDALEREQVEFVLTHSEGSAALMAGTVGRLTGQAGVAVSIKGPGVANLLPGVAACSLEGLPLVAISEAYPPDSAPSTAHKRMDHALMAAGVSKGHCLLGGRGPSFSRLAEWAEEEVPGPVLADLTGDDDAGGGGPAPSPPAVHHRLDDLRALLDGARRPLVIAGTLAIRRRWTQELADLAVPIFSTAAAKGVLDETAPHAAGIYTGVGLGATPENELLAACDLVVGLGLRANEVLAARPFGCPSVNVDPVGDAAAPGFSFAATADAAAASGVFAALGGRSWGLDRVQASRSSLHRRMTTGPFLPGQVFDSLWRHFDGQARLVLDTGNFCTIGEHVWPAKRAEWCLGSGQARYLGIAPAMAVAAAMHDPSVPTVLTVGDGGIGPAFAELRLAVGRRLPLLVVLMSDGGFGSIRTRARQAGLTQRPLVVPDFSWLGAAEGLGMPTACHCSLDDLAATLAIWRPADGPLFVEARFDPAAYEAMVEEIR